MTLQWFTELPAAITAARREHKPILSLRLLGRLDEARSCANSRFFRAMLYPDPEIGALLREGFILHWRSVRPVPIVTIDFGDGRRIERTLTGNSVHLVLDPQGRPIDAVPGMYPAAAFLQALQGALELSQLQGLARAHRRALERLDEAWERALEAVGRSALDPVTDETWRVLAQSSLSRRFPSAREAGVLALTKARVEMPLLDRISPLERTIAEDGLRNEYLLHRQIHELFAEGAAPETESEFTDWIYRELFLMPLEDPWLGLEPESPFSALVT